MDPGLLTHDPTPVPTLSLLSGLPGTQQEPVPQRELGERPMFWPHLPSQPSGNSTLGSWQRKRCLLGGKGLVTRQGQTAPWRVSWTKQTMTTSTWPVPARGQCLPAWHFCAWDRSGLTDSFPKSLFLVISFVFFLCEIPAENTTSPASLNLGNADYLGRCLPSPLPTLFIRIMPTHPHLFLHPP